MTIDVNIPQDDNVLESSENCVEKNENDLEEQPNTDVVTADEKNTEENSQLSVNENDCNKKESDKQVVESSTSEVEPAKNKDQELIVIQDSLYPIKLLVPGGEVVEIQVSPQELVQEIHQLVKDRESTCHRTCFKLTFDGATMDNFCELKNIEGLKEGSVIKLVEESYSVREARIHLRHIRDLLHSLDNIDAHYGVDCSSVCYVNTITNQEISSEVNLASNNGSAASVTINTSKKEGSGRSSPEVQQADQANNGPASNNDHNSKKSKRANKAESNGTVDCTPPDYIMPGSKDRLVTPVHPRSYDNESVKMSSCLKLITMSLWNPPPGNRRLHGDLIYVYAVTNEGKRFHITCNPRGWFVNQSDIDVFNPKPAQGAQIYHSLIDLLNILSPQFKKNFAILNKKRFNRHPFERLATPFQVNNWTCPELVHEVDHVRAEDTFSSRLTVEEHLPGQNTRDWNEEISGTRELARTTLPERLLRERAMYKVHSDFVAASTRGAILCVDGNVMAINPGEAKNMRMYIWNNIFFSLGFDVRDHYKDYGGHHAAFYAPSADLNGVRAYGRLDIPGLNVLGTCVVDYKGYRVTAQTIIPGILEREQEQSVVYGSIDFGKNIRTTEKFLELLNKTTKKMHIIPHSIKDAKMESIKLESSIECKGILGNDKRHYILDLQKSFPPDVNFLPPHEGEYEEPKSDKDSEKIEVVETEESKEQKRKYFKWQTNLCEEGTKMGFPKKHLHRLVTHRPELIDAYADVKYHEFIRICTAKIVQYRNEEKQKQTEKDTTELEQNKEDKKKMMAEWQDEAVRSAAKEVGSYKEDEFDIRFNPDVFSPGLNFDESDDEIEKERSQIVDLANFLVKNQIPAFVKECTEQLINPMDGHQLTCALHEKGIGVRYLGKIVPLFKDLANVQHIYKIGVMEVIVRATKHVMRMYLQDLDNLNVGCGVSHFLNCLLSSANSFVAPTRPDDMLQSKKKKNKNRNKNRQNNQQQSSQNSNPSSNDSPSTNTDAPWHKLTPEILWEQISKECLEYYAIELPDVNCADDLVNVYDIQKISVLRRLCHVVGVQLVSRDYQLDVVSSKHKKLFTDDDVIRLFPVIKHAPPRATDAHQFFLSAQQKLQQGAIREAFELYTESLNLFTNVYGAIHTDIAVCYRQLAKLHYMFSEHNEAITTQLKAVIISERCNGVDSADVITDLMNLALYCFASQKISTSLKLLYRARYLLLLLHGCDHPEIALVDSNIGLVLHGVQEYELSLKFLDEALKLNEKYHGAESQRVALSHHLLARAHSCKGAFRSALMHEKETFKLYKNLYGDKHDKTIESAECLRHLTEQAVTLQRTMNEIYKNGASSSFPPLQITAPSMQSVLDLMNIINGIIFIPLSSKDLDLIRKEVLKQQQLKQMMAAGQTAEKSLATGDTNTGDSQKGAAEQVAPPSGNEVSSAADNEEVVAALD